PSCGSRSTRARRWCSSSTPGPVRSPRWTTAGMCCRTPPGCWVSWPIPESRGSTSGSAPGRCWRSWVRPAPTWWGWTGGFRWMWPRPGSVPGRCRVIWTRASYSPPGRWRPTRCAGCSPRARPLPATSSTSATASSRRPTRTCCAGSSTWSTPPRHPVDHGTGWFTPGPGPDSPVGGAVVRVAVVGGGVAGLAAAHRLRELLGPAAQITVYDQATELGGKLRTGSLAGLVAERGAESFLVRSPGGDSAAVALARRVGLGHDLVHPRPLPAGLWCGGELRPLPAGTLLGVPGDFSRLAGVARPAGDDRDTGRPVLG